MYHSIMAKKGTTFRAMSLLWYITEHNGWEFLKPELKSPHCN